MKIGVVKIQLIIKLVLILVIAAVVIFVFFKLGIFKDAVNYNPPEPTTTLAGGGLDFLKLPDGLTINIFSENLTKPRVITFDPRGRMLVSETEAGRVIRLEDKDGDGKAESKTAILENLRKPHGLAFYPVPSPEASYGASSDPKTKVTYLYVAETHQVSRFTYNVPSGTAIDAVGQNIANLPADGRHFTRTIAFGPNFRKKQIVSGQSGVNTLAETKLYVSVGSSCDVCVEDTWKRAAILESDPDGRFTAEFAGGLRNSVFFAFNPKTKEIWATEMGRDNLGDDLPPDEINIVRVAGDENQFGARRYGWPFCYGNRIEDKTFKPAKISRADIPTDCRQTEPAFIEIPAHSAPLGLAFVPSGFGPKEKEWEGDLLVAFHGSWNRSVPTGYKIVRYDLDKNGNVARNADGKPVVEDFISGWLTTDNKIIGRPVDLKFGPDGALYISDDSAGIIYRVVPI